jgi:hypothetical protein
MTSSRIFHLSEILTAIDPRRWYLPPRRRSRVSADDVRKVFLQAVVPAALQRLVEIQFDSQPVFQDSGKRERIIQGIHRIALKCP